MQMNSELRREMAKISQDANRKQKILEEKVRSERVKNGVKEAKAKETINRRKQKKDSKPTAKKRSNKTKAKKPIPKAKKAPPLVAAIEIDNDSTVLCDELSLGYESNNPDLHLYHEADGELMEETEKEDNEELLVEILEKKMCGRVVYLKVKWDNGAVSEAPLKDVKADFPELVEAWRKNQKGPRSVGATPPPKKRAKKNGRVINLSLIHI